MPKNPATEILRRWQAMDAALGDYLEGLHVRSFAERWGVSVKTVRRDLEAFRKLGQLVEKERDDRSRWVWHYKGGEFLFVRNVLRRGREAVAEARKPPEPAE